MPSCSAASGVSAARIAWNERSDAAGTRSGTLAVPVSRSRPGAGEMRLPLRRYDALDGAPHTVLLLAGGPGESGLAEAATGSHRPLVDALRRSANVVALDQRGAGAARPAIEPVVTWGLELGHLVTREQALAHAQALSRTSAAQWRAQGLVLDDFGIRESADDVIALVDALGLERVALFGQSYGTQLGLQVLRERPERCSSAVFMNVEAPHQTVKRPLLVDAALRRVLEPAQLATLERLLSAEQAWELDGVTVAIGRFELQRVVARALGRHASLASLRQALDAASRSRPDLGPLAAATAAWKASEFGGLQLVVDSASGVARARRAEIERERSQTLLGDAVDFPLPHVAEALGVTELGEAHQAAVCSDVPVLFVSGALDGRTPPDNVEEIVGGFPRARHVVQPDGMHEVGDYVGDAQLLATICEWLTREDVA
jgi:pimeloyl-ACP methyl ester carboxylesterase